MSRIDDLIRQYCPDGVVTRPIGDLGEFFGGLSGKSKVDFEGGNARYVTYMNVFSNPATHVESEDRVKVADGERQRRLRLGDILFTGSSESLAECGISSVVTREPPEPTYLNSFCIGYRLADLDLLDPEFAKHLFRSTAVRHQIVRTANGVTRFNVSKARLANVAIPLPPLEVQREIVRVLDMFQSLEAELEAELEARRRQYAHYRDSLLDFTERGGVRWMTLGELMRVLNGAAFKSEFFNTDGVGLPLIRVRDINTGISGTYYSGDYEDRYLIENGDLVIGMDGDFRAIQWSHGRSLLNQRVCRLLDFADIVDPVFVLMVVRRSLEVIHSQTASSTVKHLSSRQLEALPFPVPSRDEQARIVEVLGGFEQLTADLSIGIPAELAARRSQYEYYRNRLLAFEEAA